MTKPRRTRKATAAPTAAVDATEAADTEPKKPVRRTRKSAAAPAPASENT